MGWVEYATLGILVIGIAILVLSVFSLSGRHRLDPAKEVREMKLEMVEKIAEMKGSVAQALAESMMRFNDQVNDKLTDNNSKSSENIAAFRLSVNNELGTFQEKITARLNDSFSRLGESVDKRMGAINEKVEDRLSKGFIETNETFRQISERVKVIDEAQKNIQGLSTEMIGLQNILRNNQARGSFGEFQLNQLLFSVFGDNKGLYQTQYTIREASGKRESVRADAVIFMPD
ncbi:MAG TPA: DNA recombination protein RmuC, partial [Candidatus Izemoplasmatales bacterium]|nr:DNA recombination protein RmuC [Candidatus Izemoplasmatales bacterium]